MRSRLKLEELKAVVIGKESKMKVTVILTCFNRKDKTLHCIDSIEKGNPSIEFEFIVVDDHSTDGTIDALAELQSNIHIINGNGSLYWAGGMRQGISYYFGHCGDAEYALLINDDVAFFDHVIERMIEQSSESASSVIVGATCDSKGNFTYGAMKLIVPRKKDIYRRVLPTEKNIDCDTFNCNCVLIDRTIFKKAGNFDKVYTHSLGDIDYGLTLKRNGAKIISSSFYVGVCEHNDNKGTWDDNSLGIIERIKKKESPKGAPSKEWFHFMKKNFGFFAAVRYTITPFIRILLRK